MTTSNSTIDRSNLIYRMGLVTRRWRQVLDREFRVVGLTDATWRPLLHLQLLGDGILQKELAASVGIEGPSLVRILDALVAKGLIQRSEDRSDRRVKRLCLTSAGHLVVARICDILLPLENQLLHAFSDQEITRFGQFIQRCETTVNNVWEGVKQ